MASTSSRWTSPTCWRSSARRGRELVTFRARTRDDVRTDVHDRDRLLDWRLDELYQRHAQQTGRLAFLLTGDPARASDVTQDVFVRSFGRYRDLRDPSGFEAYLRRSAVDRARAGSSSVGPTSDDPVWNALLRLPFAERAAIVLRFYEGLDDDQVAQALRCGERTARSRLRRGLAALGSAAGEHRLERDLPRLVSERAGSVRIAPNLHHATRSRARRRRNLTGVLTVLVVLASLWGLTMSIARLRAGAPEPVPPTPTLVEPSAWRGIFPQASREQALAAQRAADDGDPTAVLQRRADHVAAEYAATVLGWTESVREPAGAMVDPRMRGPLLASVFSCDPAGVEVCPGGLLRVDLTLERPFRDRPGGIWVITAASGAATIQPLPPGVPPTFVTVRDQALVVTSTLTGHALRPVAGVPAPATVGSIAVDPGGTWVAFDVAQDDRWQVVLAEADGSSAPTVLGSGRSPSFGTDGRLAWERRCSPGDPASCEGLEVMDLSSGRARVWRTDAATSIQGPSAWLGGELLVPTRTEGDLVVVSRILDPRRPDASLGSAPSLVAPGDQAWWVPLGAWDGKAVMLRACCGPSPAARSLVLVDPASSQTTTVLGSVPCCVATVGPAPGPILMAGLGGTRYWIDAQGVRHGIGDRFVGNAASWSA